MYRHRTLRQVGQDQVREGTANIDTDNDHAQSPNRPPLSRRSACVSPDVHRPRLIHVDLISKSTMLVRRSGNPHKNAATAPSDEFRRKTGCGPRFGPPLSHGRELRRAVQQRGHQPLYRDEFRHPGSCLVEPVRGRYVPRHQGQGNQDDFPAAPEHHQPGDLAPRGPRPGASGSLARGRPGEEDLHHAPRARRC